MRGAAFVRRARAGLPLTIVVTAAGVGEAGGGQAAQPRFAVEEATIADLHQAIRDGRTTCTAVVQAYVERARAYNGSCTALVTRDGAPIPVASGATRAGGKVAYAQKTVAASTILPGWEMYAGTPLDFGRMGPSASDPAVSLQYGMVAGVPEAGQVNALSTINLRGERSVSCPAACDAPPAAGPLPASCPSACERLRTQPDALERAADLDRRYGRAPDLAAMPMYCVALSFKDVFDTQDMRTTGGADVAYGIDVPPADATIVARLRERGAIIYAKANLDEYNAGSGDPGGDAKPSARDYGAGAQSTWGGTACNPYDTERETGGSSSGSAAGVAANLAACSICEETGGSCRQPAWRNGIVGLVTTKGLLPYGGAIGADPYLDRAGVHCRTVGDVARVVDALRGPDGTFFDARDPYSAVPRGLVSKSAYASYVAPPAAAGAKPLARMRIGIVREYMVKHAANDVAMSDLANAEITGVLGGRLGAPLVESVDPAYPDDPAVPNMTFTFQQALAEILPFHVPEIFKRTARDGSLLYAVPGWDVTTRDYAVKVGQGKAPLSPRLNIRTLNDGPSPRSFAYDLARYLLQRGDPRVTDWASLNANATYYSQTRVAAMKNWEHVGDLASAGIDYEIKMRDVMRLVVEKVMQQNGLDVLVNPTTTLPAAKIGGANQPEVNGRPVGRYPTSANLGIPEITVPAGMNSVVYEPAFTLNADRTAFTAVANDTTRSALRHPMPVGLSFWAGPGGEPAILAAAGAYEAATKHRVAPPAFGPVAGRGSK